MANHDYIIEKKSVICMQCALARVGLSTITPDHLDVWTPYIELDGMDLTWVRYLYNPNIDFKYELTSEGTNPLLLCPSKERALIEYIKCEKWRDEGPLIEALKDYLEFFKNIPKLYAAAEYFSVSREELDYWIKEAEEDIEI